ncbi:hypothetical protein GPECTOR_104g81 [Gonium pectorale]|uniref:Uncharacterized protein n=1 Tax=Gonium pectorale TaxID=33097 RepID=A0A150G0V1_GONPE|nr:hypothetical protein GPECTOR_104g81 [Gonium pectorale]|eukprot:KXZ43075.1 hypothetical protein GPECTOR_104g81 [Gonium pectorale]
MAARARNLFWLLPSELLERIGQNLERNEVAATFRLVSKAIASQLRGPEHTAIRLSQPVPPHAFAAHWLAPGATRGLTLKQRRRLLSFTAGSGVVANLEVAVQAAGCTLAYEAMHSASAGQLASCKWLHGRGCPMEPPPGDEYSGLLAAAMSGGHRHMRTWLQSLPLSFSDKEREQAAVARSCDLAALQRTWRPWFHSLATRQKVLAAAAGSPTPDWAAKVEWLEANGCPHSGKAAEAAASVPDGASAAARLAWLRGRGYPISSAAAVAAARAGNVAAVQYLLAEARAEVEAAPRWQPELWGVFEAAEAGQLEVLRVLHAAGVALGAWRLAECAARGGRLHVLAWLVEALGEAAAVLEQGWVLLAAAAQSGSVEALAWLRARGCAFSGVCVPAAARSGCEAALEWLLERGCPMPAGGWEAYVAACGQGDLAMAAYLRRLGVPWGPQGTVFGELVSGAPPAVLRWLLEEGCPVGDYGAARRELRRRQEVVGERGCAEALTALERREEEEEEERRGREAAVGVDART